MERERFVALDSWRGICALLVVLFHFPVSGVIRALPLVANGYLFVDFFFVLSGFVIATAYEGRLGATNGAWRFLVRRFGRLWPLHVTILATFVSISLFRGNFDADEQHSASSVVTNLLMIHGLGLEPSLTWNGPSWSISVEWALYAIFAALSLIPWRRAVYAVLVVVGVLVLLFKAPYQAASTYDFGLFRGLAGFFAGALLTRLPRARVGFGAEVAVSALLVVFVWMGELLFLAPFVFALSVYIFAWSDGPISRVLQLRPFVLLGDWSYSTYMVHTLIAAVIWNLAHPLGLTASAASGHLKGSVPLELVLAAAYLSATILVSAVTYSVVEKPGRQWFNRLASAKFPASPTQSQSSIG